MCVPWEDADKMMTDLKSTEWKQWKATAETVGTEMLCAFKETFLAIMDKYPPTTDT
jgi:hypothetical protein